MVMPHWWRTSFSVVPTSRRFVQWVATSWVRPLASR
jgi:hypothetical protein